MGVVGLRLLLLGGLRHCRHLGLGRFNTGSGNNRQIVKATRLTVLDRCGQSNCDRQSRPSVPLVRPNVVRRLACGLGLAHDERCTAGIVSLSLCLN